MQSWTSPGWTAAASATKSPRRLRPSPTPCPPSTRRRSRLSRGGTSRLDSAYGWDGRGIEHVALAREADGSLSGFVEVDLAYWDNQEMAVVDLTVVPQHRGEGRELALLEATYDVMRANDRTLLIANAWLDSPLHRFWLERGFKVASAAAQRRLVTAELDWPTLDSLHATSLAASAGYDVVELPHPAPDDMVEAMLELQRAMNDAPLDDLSLDDQEWPVERYRGYETAMAGRNIELVRLVAMRRSDGAPAGFTVVCVEEERPTLGFQEDTAVVGEHRGHRLGIRLKVEMLQLLRERYPQCEQVDTWNAESNGPMIAVNDAIGCQVVGRGIEVEHTLPTD